MLNLIALAVLLIAFYIYRHFTYWSRQGVPTCYTYFFQNAMKPFHVVDKAANDRYGKVIGVYNIFNPSLLICDAQLARKVMVNQFGDFMNHWHHANEDDMVGESLSSLRDHKWRQHRQILNPGFSNKQIKGYLPLIDDRITEFMQTIADGQVLDMSKCFFGLTLDILTSCAFSVKVNTAQDPDNDIARHANMFMGTDVPLEQFAIFLWPWLAVDVLKCNFWRRVPSKYFQHLINRFITDRRNDTSLRKADILQDLLEANIDEKPLTDKQIVDHSIVMVVAGHDTSAATLANAAHLLATHPETQGKLIAEIKQYLLKHKELKYETLNELRYLDCVINEALRIYPAVARITREAVHDCELDGIRIKKGTPVTISTYAVHHDSDNFEQPDKFIPERFLPDTELRHNGQAFIPFATGPRNCIGYQLAMTEMKLVLFRILEKFQFTTCPESGPLEFIPRVMVITPKRAVVRLVRVSHAQHEI